MTEAINTKEEAINVDKMETAFLTSIIVANLMDNNERDILVKFGVDNVMNLIDTVNDIDYSSLTPDEQDDVVVGLLNKLNDKLKQY